MLQPGDIADMQARLATEVGYLRGILKTTLIAIEDGADPHLVARTARAIIARGEREGFLEPGMA